MRWIEGKRDRKERGWVEDGRRKRRVSRDYLGALFDFSDPSRELEQPMRRRPFEGEGDCAGESIGDELQR